MTENVKESVKAFIVENFLFGDAGSAPADDASLIENDIIDSTGVLELVAFLEDRFGITVADADIVPANLDSVERISTYVDSKRAASSVAAE